MGVIGYFGNNRFEVSSKGVLPLQDFHRSTVPKKETIDRLGMKSLTEYTGPGLDTVTFTIKVNAELGQSPRKTLDKWTQLAAAGTVDVLVIGNKPLGTDLWMLTGADEGWDTLDGSGAVLKAGIDLSFEEYMTG